MLTNIQNGKKKVQGVPQSQAAALPRYQKEEEPKHMFYEEIRIKQGLSYEYISFCPLRILYNSKFILMATSLGTNDVVVTRVYCRILPKANK